MTCPITAPTREREEVSRAQANASATAASSGRCTSRCDLRASVRTNRLRARAFSPVQVDPGWRAGLRSRLATPPEHDRRPASLSAGQVRRGRNVEGKIPETRTEEVHSLPAPCGKNSVQRARSMIRKTGARVSWREVRLSLMKDTGSLVAAMDQPGSSLQRTGSGRLAENGSTWTGNTPRQLTCTKTQPHEP